MRWVIVVAAACGSHAAPVAEVKPPEAIRIDARGVGGVTATTRVTLTALRAGLPGFDVAPEPLDASTGFGVSRGGTRLFVVVPADDGSVAMIRVASKEVVEPMHHWRVGDKLVDVKAIDSCACDSEEVMSCWKGGSHVAVVIAHACVADFAEIAGAPITELAWHPEVLEATQ